MSDLKPGWKQVALGDVADVITDYWDRDPSRPERFVAGEHIDEGALLVSRWGMTNDDLVPPTFNRRFKASDVLFHSRNLRKLAQPDFGGITGEKIFVLRTRDPLVLMQELLPFLLQMKSFSDYTERMWAGSTNKFLNKTPLVRYEFALPPLEEQRRMTKLFDAGNDALNTMRQLEVSARQVHYSTIDELTSHAIQTWPITSLDDLITPDRPITYGILMPGKGFPGGVPVIKVRDFPAGRISTADLLLTDPKIDHEYRRSRLRAGDLLVSIRGTIGRLTFVPEHLNGANITQDTARLSIRPEINPTYVRCLLESSWLRMQIRKNTTGLAVQGINIGEVRRLRVPVASESGQKKIAEAWETTSMSVNAALDRSLAFQERFANLLNTVLSLP